MRAIRFKLEGGECRAEGLDLDLTEEGQIEDRSAYIVAKHHLGELRALGAERGVRKLEFRDSVKRHADGSSRVLRADRVRSIIRCDEVPFYLESYQYAGKAENGVIRALRRVCVPADAGGKPGLQAFVILVEPKVFEALEHRCAPRERDAGGVFAHSDSRIEDWAERMLECLEAIPEGALERARQIYLGRSATCELVRRKALLAASEDINTLITGDTGAGKGLVARMIHDQSERSSGPFVVCNCAAISPELFEVLFFGNKRNFPNPGTPATKGYFREADGGTLFLDEVGDLVASHQAKLLRVLEEGRVKPLGEEREIQVDVRVLSATDRDLKSESSGKHPRFRPQLYRRLRRLYIRTPTLRSHLEDVPQIARNYWQAIPKAAGKRLTPAVLRKLQLHSWPHNVRELEEFLLNLAICVDESKFERVVEMYLLRGDLDSWEPVDEQGHQRVDLKAMIDVFAEASHETWRKGEIDAGCELGESRIDDGTIKTSPDLLPFDELAPEQRIKSQREAWAVIEALLDHGFVIHKVDIQG
jgi:transcriptional regulator with AAA-type ATPase domain